MMAPHRQDGYRTGLILSKHLSSQEVVECSSIGCYVPGSSRIVPERLFLATCMYWGWVKWERPSRMIRGYQLMAGYLLLHRYLKQPIFQTGYTRFGQSVRISIANRDDTKPTYKHLKSVISIKLWHNGHSAATK